MIDDPATVPVTPLQCILAEPRQTAKAALGAAAYVYDASLS